MLTCKWKSASLTAKIEQAPALRSERPQLPTAKDWFSIRMTGVKRFPFNNFTHCLTLFSKFFSSFPHGTCSLSVSRQYLALDEIYHPFWAAFPNNSTRRKRLIEDLAPMPRRGSHPLWRPIPRDLSIGLGPDSASLNYNSEWLGHPDFKFELFPLRSPLLGESLLVSFPPLIDMLKFSG